MFDATTTFFLCYQDEFSVHNQIGERVTVESINSKNIHRHQSPHHQLLSRPSNSGSADSIITYFPGENAIYDKGIRAHFDGLISKTHDISLIT